MKYRNFWDYECEKIQMFIDNEDDKELREGYERLGALFSKLADTGLSWDESELCRIADSTLFNEIIKAYVALAADTALSREIIDKDGANAVKHSLRWIFDEYSAKDAWITVYGKEAWDTTLHDQHDMYTAPALFEE